MPRVKFAGVGATIVWLFKALFYLGLAVVAMFLAWRYRDEIRGALRQFMERLREFWNRLFGGERDTAVVETHEVNAGPPPKPFSDFADPFVTGAAGRLAPAELVRYTFEALEAWARERGCPRHPQQTAHEFTQQVAANAASLRAPGRKLADLYARLAYAHISSQTANVEPLREVWRQMVAMHELEPSVVP